MRKNKAPNTEPYRRPAFTNFQLEDWPSKTTLCRLLWRNDSIRPRRLPFISLFFSLRRKPLCQTLSNALDKFKKTSNDRLALNALKILWVIEISWLTQESFGLSPDWILLRRLLSIINSKIASKTSFSKTLEHIGGKDSGW